MKPPVEKLSLVVRKNLRDVWDAKKGAYDQELSSLLGVSWSYTFNPQLIYANCGQPDLHDMFGTAICWYVEPFAKNVRQWLETAGEEGKDELNRIFSAHIVEIHPQEDTDYLYGGIEAKDGRLRIVFAEDNFGVNPSDVTGPEVITKVVREAEAAGSKGATKSTLDMVGRMNVREHWEGKSEEVRKSIGQLINVADIQFMPNIEENAVKLRTPIKGKDDYNNKHDIEKNLSTLGRVTLEYFQALQRYLENNKFGEDDMLQEGLQEALSSKTIGLRIVDKLEKGSYNESVFEDGTLWMQSTLEYWYVNVSDIGDTIMELL